MVDWYINKKKPPSKEDILQFEQIVDKKLQDTYFYSMAFHGFVWKNIPGTKKALFVEKYGNIAIRLRYLIKMKEYRRLDRRIIYMENCSHRPSSSTDISFIAVSNKGGIIRPGNSSYAVKKSNFHVSDLPTPGPSKATCVYEVANRRPRKTLLIKLKSLPSNTIYTDLYNYLFDDKTIQLQIDWVKDSVLTGLQEPCVFVYEASPISQHDLYHHCALTQEMKNFLDENNIPYPQSAHRFALYKLIKKYLKLKQDKFTELIKACGHEVLLRPYGFEPLDFFNKFWSSKALENFSTEDLRNVENELIATETDVFNEDRMMEEVVDKIMTLGKFEGEADDYLTDYADVMKYDSEYGIETAFIA